MKVNIIIVHNGEHSNHCVHPSVKIQLKSLFASKMTSVNYTLEQTCPRVTCTTHKWFGSRCGAKNVASIFVETRTNIVVDARVSQMQQRGGLEALTALQGNLSVEFVHNMSFRLHRQAVLGADGAQMKKSLLLSAKACGRPGPVLGVEPGTLWVV